MMAFGAVVCFALFGAVVADHMIYMNQADKLYDSREDGLGGGLKTTNCTCGKSNKDRVVGGRTTLVNEFPLMAGVVNMNDKLVFCGATIISEYHAITASHCLVPFSGQKLALLVGDHDITRDDDTQSQLIPIKEAREHERFNMETMENDIGLLVLGRRLRFNKIIGPACLPTKQMRMEGEFVKVVGWGYTSHQGKQSATLQKANLKIVPLSKCAEFNPYINLKKPTQLCAYMPSRDSCDGDSGGPLLWRDPETNRFVVVGIVSDGDVCGRDPGYYTSVAAHLSWIQANVAASRPGIRTCAKIG